MAHRAAIEVAYSFDLEQPLEEAACLPYASTRAVAAQYIYYFWEQDRARVFRILENLSRRVKGRWGLPCAEVLESLMTISVMTLFDHWADSETTQAIRQNWTRVLSVVFFISPNKRENLLKRTAREQAIKFAVSLVVTTFERFAPRDVTDVHMPFLTVPELRCFFRSDRGSSTKERFQALVPYLDGARDIKEVTDLLLQIAESRDALTMYLMNLVLVVHLMRQEAETLSIVDQMFDRALNSLRQGRWRRCL